MNKSSSLPLRRYTLERGIKKLTKDYNAWWNEISTLRGEATNNKRKHGLGLGSL